MRQTNPGSTHGSTPAPAPYRMPTKPAWSAGAATKLGADPVAAAVDQSKDAELFAALGVLSANAPLDHYFSNLHRALASVMKTPIMIVGVKDVAAQGGFKQRYKRNTAGEDADCSIEQRFIDAAVQSAKPVLHGQMAKLPTGGYLRQAENPLGSIIVAPLLLEGRVLGYLAVRNPVDGAFDETDVARITGAANIAALVVQSDLVTEEANNRRAELGLMLETARTLAAERDLVKFFTFLHGLVRNVMDAETFFIGLGSWSDGGKIVLPYCVHHHEQLSIAAPLPIKGTASGHVFREGMPIIFRCAFDFRAYPTIEQGSRAQIKSGIVMPLQNGHRVIGVLSAQSSRPNAYSVRERDLLEVLGELAAIAVETSRREEEARAEAEAPPPPKPSAIPLPPV